MKTYAEVSKLIAEWQGLPRAEVITNTAEACLGWSYVWGGNGQKCTPANRRAYAERSACPATEAAVIRSRCKALSGNGSCSGCNWYPDQKTTLFFDCRGFTYWCLKQAGITITGAGATTQYNGDNWTEKGEIANLPEKVCCVFQYKNGKMQHTGLYLGEGRIIHCSGTVKEDTLGKSWTHYAVPKGIDGNTSNTRPTLRRGDKGAWVTLAQSKLVQLGFDCGTIDGVFGAKTQTAVKDFQRTHKDADGKPLSVDGVIGQKTWNALDGAEPAILYTVILKGLTEAQADALLRQYPGSEKTEERGV